MANSKKTFLTIILICVIALVICFVVCYMNYNLICISPSVIGFLGVSSPEEFCATNGNGTAFEKAHTYATVDEDGNLVLVMSDREVKKAKNNMYSLKILQEVIGKERDIGVVTDSKMSDGDFLSGASSCGLDVSDDFTKVIQTPDDNSFYYVFVMPACIIVQIFEGVPSDEIRVDYIEYNENGEVTNCISWPIDE